jgi:hypothetical protein
MKRFIFTLMTIIVSSAFAQMQFLPLSNSTGFGAIFPCTAEKKSVNSQVGITNALQCRVDNGSSVCVFLTSEQPLDIQSFNKSGFKFIEEIHHQYALQMDKNYKKVIEKTVDMGGLGKSFIYEITRLQEGTTVNVKGAWLIANNKLLRGTVSCAPSDTSYMKNESAQFLQSFTVIK